MGNTPPTAELDQSITGDLRRTVLEADAPNLARLMTDTLIRRRYKFYAASIDGTYQEATRSDVIMILHRALLLRSYDEAIAEFHVARMASFPLDDDAEFEGYPRGLFEDDDLVLMEDEDLLPLGDLALMEDEELPPLGDLVFMEGEELPPLPAALPEGAVLLGPAQAHLPATSIVRHVVDQVICSYNRANMAVHLRHIMFLGEHRNDPRVLDLIERSLEYGYDAVEAEWGLLMNDA